MSANEFYLNKGLSPKNRYVMFNLVGTVAVWTPTTSTKVVLTGLNIFNNGAAGTIEFTWGDLNINDRRIFVFAVGASSVLSPTFGPVEGTMYDRTIQANVSASGSYGWHVTATGFEID